MAIRQSVPFHASPDAPVTAMHDQARMLHSMPVLDSTLQAPVRIAAEIDPNLHSCGSVAATGAADLAQPEPNFYLVGAKSYGRAPTFLALTGYEQVRSVVAELAGDHEAARRVELVLPDTGVCGGAGLFDASGASLGGACCAVPSQVLQIGLVPASV
jgi:hypothetical protein